MITTLSLCLVAVLAYADNDSVSVELRNAQRAVTYRAALHVNGETVMLKNDTLTATKGNEIAALVVSGGKLVLDHCTIVKTGDGIRTGGEPKGGDGMRMRSQGPRERPDGDRPQMGDERPDSPRQGGSAMSPQMPKASDDSIMLIGGQRQMPISRLGGMGGPGGGGDDGFNFYGLNSAVVAVGEGSQIEMIGCQVTTDAEYANAVFSCDGATVVITEGVTVNTTKDSSRGLFATYAGIITATGSVLINTRRSHCAPLATDRGGGIVTVGTPGTKQKSILNSAGEGSPCIYSTGDITAYNTEGVAQVSQTMVIEGKNTITIENWA